MLKNAAMHALRASGLNALARAVTSGQARILTYHGVDQADDPVMNLDRLQVPPDVFAAQLDALGRQFQWVTLSDLSAGLRGEQPLPSRAMAVTFDDGYRNNLTEAAPVLRAKGIPATFFVATQYIEGSARPWWYALRAAFSRAGNPSVPLPDGRPASLSSPVARRDAAMAWEARLRGEPMARQEALLREVVQACGDPDVSIPYTFMSPDDVARLARDGFDVQSHGAAHASAATESADLFLADVAASLDLCHRWTGARPTCLAYPYGDLPPSGSPVDAGLRRMGITSAVTTRPGRNRVGQGVERLLRYDVNAGRSPLNLSCILSGVPGVAPGAGGA